MPVEANAAVENQPTPQAAAPAEPTNHQDAFAQAVAASQPAATPNPAPAATPEVAPAAAAPVTPAAAAQANYRELAAKAGLNADQFKTDQELFEALLNERQQLQPLANVGRQFAPHLSEFEKYLESQKQAQPAAAAAAPADPNAFDLDKHFAEKWGAPAWDPKWDFYISKNMLTRDEESGLLIPAPGYEAIVAPHIEKINDALEQQSAKHRELFRGNPYKAIHEALAPAWKHEIRQMLQQEFGQQQSQQQQQTEIDRFEQQYAAQLFDQNGQPNQLGQRFGQIVNRMIGDPENPRMPEAEALYLAAESMGLAAQTPAPAAQPAIAPTPSQASGQKVESFIDQARRNASHQPSSAPYAAPTHNPTQPFVTSEVELANMWTQAAQAVN